MSLFNSLIMQHRLAQIPMSSTEPSSIPTSSTAPARRCRTVGAVEQDPARPVLHSMIVSIRNLIGRLPIEKPGEWLLVLSSKVPPSPAPRGGSRRCRPLFLI